jgi:hypothetical protein
MFLPSASNQFSKLIDEKNKNVQMKRIDNLVKNKYM